MIYEILMEDEGYVYVKVFEDTYEPINMKMRIDEFEEWKKGKVER